MQALGLRVPVSLVMARQPMPKALSSLQSDQRSYTSELSWYPEFGESSELLELLESWYPRKEGNLEFAGYQGCSGYNGCGVAVI
jgi:hypothetical protein